GTQPHRPVARPAYRRRYARSGTGAGLRPSFRNRGLVRQGRGHGRILYLSGGSPAQRFLRQGGRRIRRLRHRRRQDGRLSHEGCRRLEMEGVPDVGPSRQSPENSPHDPVRRATRLRIRSLWSGFRRFAMSPFPALIAAISFAAVLAAPSWSAPKKPKEDPALKPAQERLARLQTVRDSLSNLRWRLRQTQLDSREGYQAELDRVRDSLEAAATERSRLLEDVGQALARPAEVKSGPDPFVKKTEQLRQEMIDRAQMLKDRVRYGLPWEQETRSAANTNVIRGLESYPGPLEGLEPLYKGHLAEWDFSRQIEREEG